MLILLAPRLPLLVLVSPQMHSTLSLMLAPGLVNVFILEDALMLIALLDASPEVSQLLRTLGKHLLSPLLPLRRRLVLIPGHLLPLGLLQASSLTKLSFSSSLLLPLPLLLKGEYIL